METLLDAPTNTSPCLKGRPREFDVDQALAAALRVFWSKGYEAASLSDLTEAMGITKPSLYAAFGNKEALFRKTLDLYEAEKMDYMRSALDAPTARGVAERLLRGSLHNQMSCNEPKGCMGVISTMTCGNGAEGVRSELMSRRESSIAALTERFARAQREGDLPADIDPRGLTNLIFTQVQGMAVLAGSGVSLAELEAMVETGLRCWPSA